MEKTVTISDNSREGTRDVKAKVDTDKVIDFLMSLKKDGSPLPDHDGENKSFWRGYEAALRDLINEYDLVDTIADYDDFAEWLAEDEQERRGF